jgi:hypothetical protein
LTPLQQRRSSEDKGKIGSDESKSKEALHDGEKTVQVDVDTIKYETAKTVLICSILPYQFVFGTEVVDVVAVVQPCLVDLRL